MKLPKIEIKQEKSDINLKFYLFLKYTLQNEKVLRFPFVVSLSNHNGNRPFDKFRANGFRSKIQFY